MLSRLSVTVAALALAGATAGCDALTRSEAQEAVDEVEKAARVSAMTGTTIEVTTSFTIGAALEAAAAEVRDVVADELPCAAVSVAGPSVTIVYGAAGTCALDGITLSGRHTAAIERTDAGALTVEHTYDELSDGVLSVSGTATVTWAADSSSRTVEHDLTWFDRTDGVTRSGAGRRVQRPLGGDLATGIALEGELTWRTPSGSWDLDILDVELRWVDPVPQAGAYLLVTPDAKELTISFARTDTRTIRVTAASGRRSFDFDVVAGQ